GPAAAAARKQAQTDIAAAETSLKSARDSLAASRRLLQQLAKRGSSTKVAEVQPAAVLHDTFAAKRPDVWKVVSGQWIWEKGKLTQKQAGPFRTLRTVKNHPQNFMGRIRYRTTGGGITSVGIAYDVVGTTAWQ